MILPDLRMEKGADLPAPFLYTVGPFVVVAQTEDSLTCICNVSMSRIPVSVMLYL